ncbi:MAG TPA: ABC transporter ATP-binding protein [Candidatus Obscuribacter sp.]|nr:ABC transporter ATP-binding protein [Candidatus Obscuribacter sp.]HNA72035.1 ABC transporter ATP-binding protein [Candidatus Obscuribacter sp.]HNB15714.1 ABC transporter ATP-binding protein [Candidatus Obscuribacter sp.]HND06896.1 ABC transporter ATP-binding protein [Candidatus Obscuribacter sp.]HNG73799.1 ABC transporter ATP-binding protein [Candidatus Obscuribacter sp.]
MERESWNPGLPLFPAGSGVFDLEFTTVGFVENALSHFLLSWSGCLEVAAINPVLRLMRLGWHFAGQRRPLIVLYLVLFLLAQIVALAEPYVIGRLLNCLQAATAPGALPKLKEQVLVYLAIFAATQLGFWLFHGPGRLIERYAAFHIRADYKMHLFEVLLAHPLQWHRDHHSGDNIDKVNKASTALWRFFDESFDLLYMIFRLCGAVLVLLFFLPWVGVAALVATSLAAAIIVYFDRRLARVYMEQNLIENRAAAALFDYLSNVVTVLTLRLEKRLSLSLREKLMAALPVFQRGSWLNEWKWCLTTILITLMIVCCMAGYVWQALVGGAVLMAGTFFTLFEYLRRIGDSFYSFALTYGTVVQNAADVESANAILLEARSQEALPLPVLGPALPENWRRIVVENLSFNYEDDEHREHHLYDVSIVLERGKSVALVGPSGSGKTTLLSLLRGIYFTEAAVSCDGAPLPYGLKHLAACTTLMPQDPEIFNDSVEDNISFATAGSEVDLKRALVLARFEPVVERLNQGLKTNVQEKGVNLSGGEKQRLALARGLFFAQDSDIVLADEPTSSVDAENERLIYQGIIEECRDKCFVSAVHKLNLLDLFDYVYLFGEGRIVEQGSLSELLIAGGEFSRVYRENYG